MKSRVSSYRICDDAGIASVNVPEIAVPATERVWWRDGHQPQHCGKPAPGPAPFVAIVVEGDLGLLKGDVHVIPPVCPNGLGSGLARHENTIDGGP